MSLLYLLVGLAMWYGAHLLKRVLPAWRSDLTTAIGTKSSRGVMSVLVLAALVLMIIGYRGMDITPIYTPLPGIGHLNNLLMVFALFLFLAGKAGGRLSARIRHPMLLGTVVWMVAHLLVNGDLASILLFGGIGFWALFEIYIINLHEGPWEVPLAGNAVQDGKLVLISLFLFMVITGIHWLLDRNPFLGTYP